MQLTTALPIALSTASFIVSAYTLWIAHLRRGRLQMTQPMMIFVGRDDPMTPKFWLRTLLFSSGSKGHVIENMILRVRDPLGAAHNFDFWTYEDNGKQQRGSGLHIGNEGIVLNSNFLLRENREQFYFITGEWILELVVRVLGIKKSFSLKTVTITINGQQSAEIIQILDLGIFFDWDAQNSLYVGHAERRPFNSQPQT